MTEVELKASLQQAQTDTVVHKLAEFGFLPRGRDYQVDTYFNAPDRDFRRTDEALRLRTADGKTCVTYKSAKLDARSNTRQELETGIEDHETAQRLLEALGYTAVFTVSKSRWSFANGPVTACLDQVHGLGDYIELEILLEDETCRDEAVDSLLQILQQLDISPSALTRKSYLELLMAKATE